MGQYVISVIAVGILGSVISILSPEGEGAGIKKYINLIIGLAVTLVCISPISSAIEYINELDFKMYTYDDKDMVEEYEGVFDSSYTAAEVYNLKMGIKSSLGDKFSISEEECNVAVTLDDDKKLECVLVTLYGSAIWCDSDAIEDHLTRLLGCEVWVAIG